MLKKEDKKKLAMKQSIKKRFPEYSDEEIEREIRWREMAKRECTFIAPVVLFYVYGLVFIVLAILGCAYWYLKTNSNWAIGISTGVAIGYILAFISTFIEEMNKNSFARMQFVDFKKERYKQDQKNKELMINIFGSEFDVDEYYWWDIDKFAEAYENAKKVTNSKTSTQAQINEASKKLKEATEMFVPAKTSDKDKLIHQLNNTNQIIKN